MKCVLQLVRRATGERSPVVTEERNVIADVLFNSLKQDDCQFVNEDYVLVVADVLESDDGKSSLSIDFSQAPMMTIEHFIASYSADFARSQVDSEF